MTRYLTAHFVASGTEVIAPCPDCGSERSEVAMHALTDDGPTLLGTTTACACTPDDAVFRCALCIAVLPCDGRLIYLHVRETHGG